MQGTDPFLAPAASGGDSENAAPARPQRSAAPSRRRSPGRDAEAGEPRPPPPDRAPPPPGGAGLSVPLAASFQEPPGDGTPPPSNRRSTRRERPQEGHRLPLSLAAPLETPSLRLAPSPPLDFTASRVPHFLPTTMGGRLQRRGAQWRVGAGFSSGRPWLAAKKAPHPRTDPPVSEAVAAR